VLLENAVNVGLESRFNLESREFSFLRSYDRQPIPTEPAEGSSVFLRDFD
jgi:hypothetical protein